MKSTRRALASAFGPTGTGVFGFTGPFGDVVLRPSVGEDDGDPPDVGSGAVFKRESDLDHVTQGRARHGPPAHVLDPGHGPLHVLDVGEPAQGELRAHFGGVLEQAHVRPRPGHVQKVHDAVDQAFDQVEVGGTQTFGAVEDKHQVHDAVAAVRVQL